MNFHSDNSKTKCTFFRSLCRGSLRYCCRCYFSIVTVIQFWVMRARNGSTRLIIIKCCSMSFILTANVYTVSARCANANNNDSWVTKRSISPFTVHTHKPYFLCMCSCVSGHGHSLAWVRIAIN